MLTRNRCEEHKAKYSWKVRKQIQSINEGDKLYIIFEEFYYIQEQTFFNTMGLCGWPV